MGKTLMIRRNKRKNGKHNQIPPTAATASSLSAPPPPPWTELPVEVTANILGRLGAEEILKSVEKVCTTWNNVCRRDPSMWRVVHLRSNRHGEEEREFNLMCRCAVDRSQGQLIDLSITHFGGDELLTYVAGRSSYLRRLKLENRFEIRAFALTEAVKKLLKLEELHLLGPFLKLGAKDVETIGISCPLLRSFSYRGTGVALAIAKNMPNLRSLRLYGDVIDKEVLEAILDGCPLLESLDTRYCKDLDDDLKAGDLGERCRKQIKDLRLPLSFFDSLLALKNIGTIYDIFNED